MTDLGIAGKRAVVTGGGGGIGYAIAKKLLDNGAIVYIIDNNRNLLEKATSESGKKLIPLEVDVSDWEATRKVVKDILPIQLLVNNAAVLVSKSVLDATEEEYYKMMDVNLKGNINLTQFIAQDLIDRNMGGKVVNMSSQCSTRVTPNSLIYSCTKAAIDMATKCFALELGPKSIKVNAINPTVVRTEMGRRIWSKPDLLAESLNRIPVGRLAEAEDIADAALFLLSDNSAMITGHCLFVDGGYTLI